MNAIRRHIPNFVDHDEKDLTIVNFSSTQELLDIPFVKKWTETPAFVCYRMWGTHLMAIMQEFDAQRPNEKLVSWWVVGSVFKPTEVEGIEPMLKSNEAFNFPEGYTQRR